MRLGPLMVVGVMIAGFVIGPLMLGGYMVGEQRLRRKLIERHLATHIGVGTCGWSRLIHDKRVIPLGASCHA